MFKENVKYVMEKLHGYGEMTSDLVVYRYTNFSALNDVEEIRQQYMDVSVLALYFMLTKQF